MGNDSTFEGINKTTYTPVYEKGDFDELERIMDYNIYFPKIR